MTAKIIRIHNVQINNSHGYSNLVKKQGYTEEEKTRSITELGELRFKILKPNK